MSGSLQNISGLDRVIHEPARLTIVALLSSITSACASIAVGGSRLHTSGENISRKNPAHGIPPHSKRKIGFRPV